MIRDKGIHLAFPERLHLAREGVVDLLERLHLPCTFGDGHYQLALQRIT
jgi:hypothetical protein